MLQPSFFYWVQQQTATCMAMVAVPTQGGWVTGLCYLPCFARFALCTLWLPTATPVLLAFATPVPRHAERHAACRCRMPCRAPLPPSAPSRRPLLLPPAVRATACAAPLCRPPPPGAWRTRLGSCLVMLPKHFAFILLLNSLFLKHYCRVLVNF